MMRMTQTRAGFTIVEIMIAIAILVTITGLTWTSISSMYKTRDIVEERTERYQVVRITMRRMASELASAYIAGEEFGGEPLPGEEFVEPNSEEELAAALAAAREEPIQYGMIGREDEINFSSFANQRTVESERASHHAEIGYFVRRERNDDGDMVNKLMRRADSTPDDDLTRGGVIYTMLEDIEEIEFEYWDAGTAELGTFEEIGQGRWVNSWDTTRREHAGRLPQRIRITLSLPAPGNSRAPEVFTTQTQINTTEVLEF